MSAETAGVAHVFVGDLDEPVVADDDRRHLERVLRLRTGELVSVADGAGGCRLTRWEGAGRLTAVGEVERHPRPAPLITVAFAIVKRDRPDWAVQKLTEIGVDRIVPMVTQRVVIRWDEARADRATSRLRAVARAAAMQSRRLWLPDVDEVRLFTDLVAESASARQSDASALAAMAAPGGASPTLDRPTLLIGPEGGWAPEELSCGLPTVGLGPTVLRTETAAVAAGVLLVALRAGLVTATP